MIGKSISSFKGFFLYLPSKEVLYAVCDDCTSMDRIMFEVCFYSKYTELCVHLSYVP